MIKKAVFFETAFFTPFIRLIVILILLVSGSFCQYFARRN